MLRDLAETLVVATVGGLALGLTGFPAGFLSGAILAVAAFALAGRPMRLPLPLTRAIFVLIGISLGAVVTPATLQGMATYPLSIAALIVAMIAVGAAGETYLRIVHGWDRVDASLASAPGAMSQVLATGAELGADLRAIAIVQSMRVVIIAIGLPAGLAMFGLAGEGTPRPNPPLTASLADEWAILIAASLAGAFAAYRFRLPGGLLFGAMFASAALHGSGFIVAAVPSWAAITAMVALGAVVGARFTNTPLRMLLHYLNAAVGTFTVAVAVAAVFGFALVNWMSLNAAEVMIAFAPGSVDAMMLLALALHLDPVYVGAHHVTRIFLVSLSLPFMSRRLGPKMKAVTPPPPRDPPTFQD